MTDIHKHICNTGLKRREEKPERNGEGTGQLLILGDIDGASSLMARKKYDARKDIGRDGGDSGNEHNTTSQSRKTFVDLAKKEGRDFLGVT